MTDYLAGLLRQELYLQSVFAVGADAISHLFQRQYDATGAHVTLFYMALSARAEEDVAALLGGVETDRIIIVDVLNTRGYVWYGSALERAGYRLNRCKLIPSDACEVAFIEALKQEKADDQGSIPSDAGKNRHADAKKAGKI